MYVFFIKDLPNPPDQTQINWTFSSDPAAAQMLAMVNHLCPSLCPFPLHRRRLTSVLSQDGFEEPLVVPLP